MLSLILAFMLSIGGTPAGGPGNTGIQAPIDNSCNINRNFEDYIQKTASRLFSKKILEILSIEQPKTQTRLIFAPPLKEKLHLMGYVDSMNLYQAFNMNPINFTDPWGLYTDFYWDAQNKIRKKGPIPQNPADEMTRAALIQHGKNTARNAALVGIAQIPVVGKPFVAGYAVRQVGEGYIGCVNRRWNDVSVFDSGAKTFFKKATSPFTGLWDLIFGGPKKMYRAVTDESLSDKEIGTSLMEGYDQTACTAIGGYYGFRQLFKKYYFEAESEVGVFNKGVEFTPSTGITYKVFQRLDINWNQIRTAGPREFIGETNAEAARAGLRPQLPDGSFVTIHHSQQSAIGPWFEASTRYHNILNAQEPPLHPFKGKQNPYYPLGKGPGSLRDQFQTIESPEYWKWRVENQ